MALPLRCHLLIGANSTDRSRLAALLAELVGGRIYSPTDPDTAYETPYEREQLRQAINVGGPLVVDGGHLTRAQRLGFLQAVESLELEVPVRWIGWWIQSDGAHTQTRQPRKSPDCARHFAPDRAEGFLHMVPLQLGGIPDLRRHCRMLLGLEPVPKQVEEAENHDQKDRKNGTRKSSKKARNKGDVIPIDASLKAAFVRTKGFKLHAYSRLLDFERLIYLIHLLLHDPDLRLPEDDPAYGEDIEARAARLLTIRHGHCYGEANAVRANFKWLGEQKFQTLSLQTSAIDPGPASDEIQQALKDGVGFPATADRPVFERQLRLIRYLIQCPYDHPPKAAEMDRQWQREQTHARATDSMQQDWDGDRLITQRLPADPRRPKKDEKEGKRVETDAQKVVSDKLLDRDVPVRDHLLQKLEHAGVIYDRKRRRLDKDIETLITPYQLRSAMGISESQPAPKPGRNGYALGTAVFTVDQITNLHQLIKQAYTRLKDPTLLDLQESLEERLSWSGIKVEKLLPVRAFANRSIIDPSRAAPDTMAHDLQMAKVESAIRERLQIRLRRASDEASHSTKAWPLMILFHNIGWYLAFEEIAPRGHHGLIRISRLDRLKLRSVLEPETGSRHSVQRRLEDVQKSHDRLQRLCERTGGIYLGDQLELQNELSVATLDSATIEQLLLKGTLVKVRFLCTAKIFAFIREGNNRFPPEQMKISGPLNVDSWNASPLGTLKPVDGDHPYPVELILPCWTVDRDNDFRRWLFGFGKGVRIEEPASLREEHLEYANDIRNLYSDPISS